MGAEHIHGIRAGDLLDAPTFDDIAADVVGLLSGRVLVAHNARFDKEFLSAELQTARMPLPEMAPVVCTMTLARELLPGSGRSPVDCCAAFDIELNNAHRALSDAHSTAELLGCYIASTDREFWNTLLNQASPTEWPINADFPNPREHGRWLPRREGSDALPFLERIAQGLPDFSGPTEHQEYLAILDRYLMDRHLSEHESRQLAALAQDLGVGRETASRLNAE